MMSNLFEGIEKLSNGQQAALKRMAGRPLREADAAAARAFFTAVPGFLKYETAKAFTVACAICLWKQEERIAPKPLAERLGILRTLKGEDGCKGLDRRFDNLIDSFWNDDDGYLSAKLIRLIRLMKNSGAGYFEPNALYRDLINWDHPERFVQRRWMEAYLSLKTDRADDNGSIEETKEINE